MRIHSDNNFLSPFPRLSIKEEPIKCSKVEEKLEDRGALIEAFNRKSMKISSDYKQKML